MSSLWVRTPGCRKRLNCYTANSPMLHHANAKLSGNIQLSDIDRFPWRPTDRICDILSGIFDAVDLGLEFVT